MKRIVLAGGLIAFLIAFPAAAPAASSHQLYVYGSSGEIVATFTVAKCTKGKSKESGKPGFFASSVSSNGEYQLFVKVFEFRGVHQEYEIGQGSIDPNPGVTFQAINGNPGKTEYSNRFVPPYPSSAFGEIAFRQAGTLLGVGYGPSMYSRDLSDAVFLTGVVECKYKKKKR